MLPVKPFKENYDVFCESQSNKSSGVILINSSFDILFNGSNETEILYFQLIKIMVQSFRKLNHLAWRVFYGNFAPLNNKVTISTFSFKFIQNVKTLKYHFLDCVVYV